MAHPARVWDYWLGGEDHFAADREAGDRVIVAMPTMESVARAGRVFLAAAGNVLDFSQPVAVMPGTSCTSSPTTTPVRGRGVARKL